MVGVAHSPIVCSKGGCKGVVIDAVWLVGVLLGFTLIMVGVAHHSIVCNNEWCKIFADDVFWLVLVLLDLH